MLDQTRTIHYKVGGSLAFNHPTYVERDADRELLTALLAGKFCYVFNCRQMGKSSLRVRAMHHLQAKEMLCVGIDITSLGTEADPQKWYNGIITQLFLGLPLVGKINLKLWLRERDHLSPGQKLKDLIEGVILPHLPDTRIFIFIDEIDKVLSLPFSLDDFFSFIRFCYNQRADNPDYERLCFALFGVATPSDLIQDKRQTPFNIGQAIALHGFTAQEIAPLAQGLQGLAAAPEQVVQEILGWTNGQPFLTQKICNLLWQSQTPIALGSEGERVEHLIQTQILDHWESQDEPVHLKTIRDRLLRHENHIGTLLGMYQDILDQGAIAADDSAEQGELCLTGLVVKGQGELRVYNRIYQAVFSADWVQRELAKLRPYAESLAAWVASDCQDDSRLLRGQALKSALAWSSQKSLSALDYQYLNASQTIEQQESEQANRILREANRKAKRMIWVGFAVLMTSLVGSLVALRQAQLATAKQQAAQAGTTLQRLGESADRQFNFEQLNGLVSALQTVQTLKTKVKPQDRFPDYPATSPLLTLQYILSRIREKNNLTGHQEGVTSVAFSPDGQTLASASRDNTIRLWQSQGKFLRELRGHQGSVYRLEFSPDGQTLASASQDETIKVWNLQGEVIKTLSGHQGSVYSVTFSPDGRYLASAGRDRTARIWRSNGETVAILGKHQKSVDDLKFSPDGQTLVTVCRDGYLRRWSLTGKLINQFGLKDVALFGVDFSPDGQTLAGAAEDGTVRLWDLSGNLLTTLRGHQELVTMVRFSTDGQQLYSSSSDGTILVWNRQGQLLETLRGHGEGVFGLAQNRRSPILATGSEDTTVKLWDLSPKPNQDWQPLRGRLSGINFNSAHNSLALSTEDQPLTLLDVQGRLEQTFPSSTIGLGLLTSSADGQWLAGSRGAGTLQLWHRRGTLFKTLTGDTGRIYNLDISADQRYLAAGTRAGKVWIWNLQTSAASPQILNVSGDRVRSIGFNAKTGELLAATDDGQLSLWQVDGTLLNRWQAHADLISQVQWHPSGDSLVSASRDGTVKQWSRQAQLLHTLQTDPLPIQQVSFSPQGDWLATASSDGMVRLWDTEGQLRGEWRGKDSVIVGIGFTAHGDRLLSVSQPGQVSFWPVEPEYERLQNLLTQGCHWLQDYLMIHPDQRQKLPQCANDGGQSR